MSRLLFTSRSLRRLCLPTAAVLLSSSYLYHQRSSSSTIEARDTWRRKIGRNYLVAPQAVQVEDPYAMPKIRFATVTVDSYSLRDPSLDRSTPLLHSLLEATEDFERAGEPHYVMEDEAHLRAKLKELGDSGDVDLVLTLGCTGFGPRERAPEAVKSLLEREAPGLIHLILTHSMQQTPFAAVSRPVAGTYKETLYITLPGGPRAVEEIIEALTENEVLQRCVRYMEGKRHTKSMH